MRAIAGRAQGLLQSASSASSVCSTCRRTFSSSTNTRQRLDQYPAFEESSSPELGEHLAHARKTALLPYFLNREQRKLVLNRKNQSRLEYEPIYIQLGAAEERLEYINETKDVPSRYSVFKTALEKAESPQDWVNIARLFRGFMNTKHGLKDRQVAWIVRKLIDADRLHLVMRMLLEASRTGLSLTNEEVRNKVLYGVFRLAADQGFDEASTKKALTYSEQIIDLLERPEHGGGALGKRDPRRSPFVLALALEMASVRAKKHLDGVDEGGKVARYAGRLVDLLPNDKSVERPPNDPASVTARGKSTNLWEQWISVWHALRVSREVLGQAMPKSGQTQAFEEKLKIELEAALSKLRKSEDGTVEPGVGLWQACQ